MTTPNLNPDDIMAEHRRHAFDNGVCVDKHGTIGDATCLPFRLAVELAVMREREADAWDAGWYARRVWRARLESHLDPATRGENINGPLPKPANPYRAALAGEGAVKQLHP